MNEIIKIIDPDRSGDDLIAMLEAGAVAPVVVTGSSMRPFLKHGIDTVWLKREETYRRGQILFFRRDSGTFILHRIRKCYPDGNMLINGDAQAWCELARPDQAIAAVYAVTRAGKTVPVKRLDVRIRDALWYPTRPFRPYLFALYEKLYSIFGGVN